MKNNRFSSMTAVGTLIAALAVFANLFIGCGSDSTPAPTPPSTSIDYSQSQYWLSLPLNPTNPSLPVDVFYVYPTAWQATSSSDPEVCQINNMSMIKGATQALQRQATVFQTSANIFAPYYRQANANILEMPYDEQQAIVGGIPKADVFAAFDYYVKNYNAGRPFILAGHSQGSNILIYLLSEYMNANPDVYSRMIVAYVIGYSVTTSYLDQNPHLHFATGATDTGVIASYNTEYTTISMDDPVVLPGARVINPISWSTDTTQVPASLNKGSIKMNGDGTVDLEEVPVMNFADAQINTSRYALVVTTPPPDVLTPGNPLVAAGIYHNFDYALFYVDLRQNVADRINAYLSK